VKMLYNTPARELGNPYDFLPGSEPGSILGETPHST
jgi:hypothetical protein